jgi:hypothetical protein
MDVKLPLFERYRAMFALRNDGGKDAVLALASGFADDSALFRSVPSPASLSVDTHALNGDSHEIAYIFGQLSSPYSVPSLVTVLRCATEEDMVRHEAAEALGSIATDDCLPVLAEFARDQSVPRVVRESCVVALDMVRLVPLASIADIGHVLTDVLPGTVCTRAVERVPIRRPLSSPRRSLIPVLVFHFHTAALHIIVHPTAFILVRPAPPSRHPQTAPH